MYNMQCYSYSVDGTAKLWDVGQQKVLTSFDEVAGGVLHCCALTSDPLPTAGAGSCAPSADTSKCSNAHKANVEHSN